MNVPLPLLALVLLPALAGAAGPRAGFRDGWPQAPEGWGQRPGDLPPPPPVGDTRDLDVLREYARLEADAERWEEAYRRASWGSWEEQNAKRQLRYAVDAAKDLLSAPGALAGYPNEPLERLGLEAATKYQRADSGTATEGLYKHAARALLDAAFEALSRDIVRYEPRDLYGLQQRYDGMYQQATGGTIEERYFKRCRDLTRSELDRPRPPAPPPYPPAPYPPAPPPYPPGPQPYPPGPNPDPRPGQRRPRRDWQYDRVRQNARDVDMAAEASFGAANALHGRDPSARAAIADLAVLRDAARRFSNDLDQWRNDPYQTQMDYYAVVDAYARVRQSTWYPRWHPDVVDNLRRLEKVMAELEYYYPQR